MVAGCRCKQFFKFMDAVVGITGKLDQVERARAQGDIDARHQRRTESVYANPSGRCDILVVGIVVRFQVHGQGGERVRRRRGYGRIGACITLCGQDVVESNGCAKCPLRASMHYMFSWGTGGVRLIA
jgi:hypothetical protein